MAYIETARLCKHAQTCQLSMDEQLAAVVLTTLSSRPAATSSLSPTDSSLSSPPHRLNSSADRKESERLQPIALSNSYSFAKSDRDLQTKNSQNATCGSKISTVRPTSALKCCGGTPTVLRGELDDGLTKKHSRKSASSSGIVEDLYFMEIDATPGGRSASAIGATISPNCYDLSDVLASSVCNSILFDHDYQKKVAKGISEDDCFMVLGKSLASSSYHSETLRATNCDHKVQKPGNCWRRTPVRDPPIDCAGRRRKHDIKKCRKVYGVINRRLWCTQCRWKKACSRFMFRS